MNEAQNTELIIVEQLPVIRQQLEIMSAEIDQKTSDALALVCTEDTVKTVKAVRAELTKEFTDLETKRKTVKKAVLTPYEEFEAIYKELVADKFKSADAQLKTKIDEVESGLKAELEKGAMRYFAELCASESIDFVTFEQVGLNIILSVKLPALKKQIASFIERVQSDLALIDVQEHKTEIMVEYKRSLNVSKSITDVASRHQALEEEKQRQIEREAARASQSERIAKIDTFIPQPIQAPIQAPQAPSKPQQTTGKEYSATFKVFGTIEVLKGLKSYLVENNVRFENVPQTAEQKPVEPAKEKEGEKKPEPTAEPVIASVGFIDDTGHFIGGREYSYIVPNELVNAVGVGVQVLIETKGGALKRASVVKMQTSKDISEEIMPKLKSIHSLFTQEED